MKTYERLKTFVHETGIKHYVLAKRCGYSAREFSLLINGKKPILDKDILILCKALNISPNDLLGFDESA